VHAAAHAVTDAAGVFAATLGAMGILLHGILCGLEAKIVHWGDRGRK
jgi:NitT/TauT family transport system permease protein